MRATKVRSDKHGIDAILIQTGYNRILRFTHQGRLIEIGMANHLSDDSDTLPAELIDAYVTHLSVAGRDGSRPELFNWYLTCRQTENGAVTVAKGNVRNHPMFVDSCIITTSPVSEYHIDTAHDEMVIAAGSIEYHCPLDSWRFGRQSQESVAIDGFDDLRRRYEVARTAPVIGDDEVLLVLSDCCDNYFHSLVTMSAETGRPVDFSAYTHIGMVQDSFIIRTADRRVEIRYFPHFGNIELYALNTSRRALYIENVGGAPMYVRTGRRADVKCLCVAPNERKEFCRENMRDIGFPLPDGDLYPAYVSDDMLSQE